MGWCIIQTNEYDLQAITYPTICTHHKLHNNDEKKSQFSRNVFAIRDRIWCNKHLRHTTTEKYDNNGKCWYFRFDDDNKMSYEYIDKLTWWRHQLETFSALLALCAGNSSVTGEFPAQRPVTGSFDISLICAWINDWVNNREAGDLRSNRAHCDVIVMIWIFQILS